MNKLYYGYKHWTLEEIPRCFYVGKGLKHRPYVFNGRNHKWKAIVKRLGLRIEICVGPITENKSFQWETFNIVEEGTFTNNYHHNDDLDIGCNFTYGGEGASGRIGSMKGKKDSDETRKKKSERQKIVQNRPEMKICRSKKQSGRKRTGQALQNLQASNSARKGIKQHNRPHSRHIKQFTKDGIFIRQYTSIAEAAEITGIYGTNICNVCRNVRYHKTAGGFIWKYV